MSRSLGLTGRNLNLILGGPDSAQLEEARLDSLLHDLEF
jgi:hypothetical protein